MHIFLRIKAAAVPHIPKSSASYAQELRDIHHILSNKVSIQVFSTQNRDNQI